jgi:hypothetical protein
MFTSLLLLIKTAGLLECDAVQFVDRYRSSGNTQIKIKSYSCNNKDENEEY